MNIDYLRDFLDLAETLSFTRSAGNRSLSQSTLSRHIAELERQAGARLFERSTTSVRLTEAGREFYEKATVMLRGYDDLLGLSAGASSRQPCLVRVGGYTTLPTTMGILGAVNRVAAARGEGFRLRFHRPRSLSGEPPAPHPVDMLLGGDVDLVVQAAAFDAGAPRGCEGMRVCDEPLLAVVGGGSPLAGAGSVSMADLEGARPVSFVVYRDCEDIELAPMRAAGIDVSSVRPVYVQDLLEVPERAACLAPGEVAPLERSFCGLFGIGCGEGAAALRVDDERMRFSYWLLHRAGEQRPGVLAAVDLVRNVVDEAKAARPDLVNAAGNLWAEGLA